MTQKEIARALGVSEAVVSKWAKQGAPVAAGADAVAAWRAGNRRAYVSATAHAATMAALAAPGAAAYATAAGTTLNLGHERALLAQAQRINIEMKNAVLRGEYASIALLGEVLATASQAVAERFDHLPSQLRKTCPDLPVAAVDQVMAVIAKARNEWVSHTIALIEAKAEADDDKPPAELDSESEHG